ncbi:MAG TPA: hypothetical protein VK915_03280 [Gaiellaceae bacterium]|nr:hypothetical protein [Gaiellaceae bacterium]
MRATRFPFLATAYDRARAGFFHLRVTVLAVLSTTRTFFGSCGRFL